MPYTKKGEDKLNERFCWNCYNFEDRRDIDGVVLCVKGHTPRTCCEDFDEVNTERRLNGRFCWNCVNFEDRRDIDGAILCAKGHYPGGNCDEFVGRDKKFRDITNNSRYERAIVKGILMEKNLENYSLQSMISKWRDLSL